jgi:Flp pilus assembly protein TadG
VGPLFFGLVMLTIEAALLMNAQLTLDNATREAARAAAVCGDGKGAFGGASGGATCEQLAESALSANLGIVAVLGAAPGLHFDTPTDPANSGCGPSGGAYNGAPQGCPIVLSTSYTFTFLLGSLMGSAAPGIGLSSQAAVVSQR